MKDGQQVETDKNDKDPSVFYYVGSGITCFPHDPAKEGKQSSLCSSGGFINMDKKDITNEQKQQLAERNKLTDKVVTKKAVTKSNFVITPECVF